MDRSSGRVARSRHEVFSQVEFSLTRWNSQTPLRIQQPSHSAAHPLPLQRRAPLRILSHSQTRLGRSCLHIHLQAAGLVLHLRLFLPHRSEAHLRLLPPPVQGSDMQGHPPRQLSRLTLCLGMPARACICPWGLTSQLSHLFVLLTSPI